ncbi:hypothetical protein ABZ540_23680 [Nocardia xishanensis]|uniref:hypothetical protein n=1 Tax=Nocardia xishanensis TaxID=238964 RepID=UPI0033F6161D
MSDKEIVESIRFANYQPPRYTKTETGQLVTPEFLTFVQQALTGKLNDEQAAELDPQVRSLAEELSVIHLPEWHDEVGRKRAEPTVTSIKQATRVAEYLAKRGVRVHRELEEIRWAPTPGGQPGAFDIGIHITKDENGQWPTPDVEEFYDFEQIEVRHQDDGTWTATHPRGLAFEAATRTEAYAGIVEALLARIDEVRRREERHQHDD